MGFSLSWLAVRGKPAAAILSALGLRATGVPGIEGEAPVVGAASAAGWYLIVADKAEHRLIRPSVLERLSEGCEVVTCTVEEHVMFSEATGWRDGRQGWRVSHRGEDGPVGLEEAGELPANYPALRGALEARQAAEGGAEAEVDFLFDIPVALAQAFTGYRHDEASPAFEVPGFEVLEATGPAARTSWLGRLLRR